MVRAILALWLVICPAVVMAHFERGTHVQTLVVQRDGGQMVAWLRIPARMIFADLFLQETPGKHIDTTAFTAQHSALALRLAAGFVWRVGEKRLEPRLGEMRFLSAATSQPFNSPHTAQALLARPLPATAPSLGHAMLVYRLDFADVPPRGAIEVVRSLPALNLPEGMGAQTQLISEAGGTVVVPGQLETPAQFAQTGWQTLTDFAQRGLLHILTGWDHVFLVICFALAAGWSRRLAGLITAFTLGHSVSLIVSALGYSPQITWFIPAIESLIAASVVLAAWAAWRGALGSVAIAGVVGGVHGFGFGSFLSESLSREADGFFPALAGFNLGIELGQFMLIAVVLALFAGASRINTYAHRTATAATLAAIALVASYWTWERLLSLAT